MPGDRDMYPTGKLWWIFGAFFLGCFGSVSVHIFDINFAMFLQMSRRLHFELWRRILVVSVECPDRGKAACWKSHHTWWTMSQCNKKSADPKAKFLESFGCHQPTNGKLVGTSTAFPQWVVPEAGWASQFHWIVSRDVAERDLEIPFGFGGKPSFHPFWRCGPIRGPQPGRCRSSKAVFLWAESVNSEA